jgi:Flp pilus assembly secretin CpaC
MTRNTSVTAAMIVAIAALLAGADRVPAAERMAKNSSGYCLEDPCTPDSGPSHGTSTPVSNDGNARYVALVLNKSIALDLPSDVSDVFVGNPKIANVILRSKRRAYIIGMGKGQTNVYFYDPKGQQIVGLNINVDDHLISERIPAREVMVVRGPVADDKQIQIYECTPSCSPAEIAAAEKPPQNIYVLPNVTTLPTP